jgi:hypothetical protein
MTEHARTDGPLADVIAEARRLLGAAAREQVTIRLLGGVAIALLAHDPIPERLRRSYGDIDLVARREDTPRTRALLERLGYTANRRFNNLHGARRLLYYDEANGRQLDVFVGAFRMCHELELAGRLELAPETLTPADLLLTKLQVVEINRKDLVDAITLLHACPVVERMRAGAAELDLERLSDVAGRDWGWYTTLTDNLGRIPSAVAETLDGADAALVLQRAETIHAALDQAPKSLAWKVRAGVGRRVRWYELPEEMEQ